MSQLGFHLEWQFNRRLDEAAIDRFWTALIATAESRGLTVGGGGGTESGAVFVTRAEDRGAAIADRVELVTWLRFRPEVQAVNAGGLVSAE